jgi:cytochrome c oxidase subunit 2
MTEQRWTRNRRLARLGMASATTVLLSFAAVSCGDGDGAADPGAGSAADTSAADTSAAGPSAVGTTGAADAARGEQLARSAGCAGCHGPDFGGGAGPEWTGLAGSEVELADGSTVVADEAYLVRSIADPSADVVADYSLRMPANNLSDAEIADIVAFIETLADE